MAHILYCDKVSQKFNFTNHVSYPSGSSGWTDCMYIQKIIFRQWHAWVKLWRFLSWGNMAKTC